MTQAARLLDRFKKPMEPKLQEMPRVAIVCPSGDMVHKGFAMSLAAMGMTLGHYPEAGMSRVPVKLVAVEGSLIVKNRNQGVLEALAGDGVDFILFLDSDMTFPAWTLRKLLDGAMSGHDIVAGTYVKREPPYAILGKWAPETVLTNDRLHEVEMLPTGCMLIARRVFETLPGPHWFQTPVVGEGPDATLIGEDVYFCEQARKAGFRIWLDTHLSGELGHIGKQVNRIAVAPVPRGQEASNDAQPVH